MIQPLNGDYFEAKTLNSNPETSFQAGVFKLDEKYPDDSRPVWLAPGSLKYEYYIGRFNYVQIGKTNQQKIKESKA